MLSLDNSYEIYDWFKSIFSTTSGIALSVFSVLLSSKEIGDDKGFFRSFIEKYRNSEILSKSYRLLKKLDEIKAERSMKDEVIKFKSAVKKNLLYRVGISNYTNLITFCFIYFNIVMYLVPNINSQDSSGQTIKKITTIISNIINQGFSIVFSYISIICDNVIFLDTICDKLINRPRCPSFDEDKEFIIDYLPYVENPLNIIFMRKSDFLKQREKLDTTMFGTPTKIIAA